MAAGIARELTGPRTQAIIVVSRRRPFLDRVTARILELWPRRLTKFTGNFSAYWTQRHERAELLQKTYERQQENMPALKSTSQEQNGPKQRQAKDLERKLARVRRCQAAPENAELAMHFPRRGDPAIGSSTRKTFQNLGRPLFSDFSCTWSGATRSGFLAQIVAAETALFRLLLGKLPPDSESRGSAQETGSGSRPAAHERGPGMRRHRGHLNSGSAGWTPASCGLFPFGMRGGLGLQKVGQMSGGEKSKVAFARLDPPKREVLVLEEPTNDLDLSARDSLEEALRA